MESKIIKEIVEWTKSIALAGVLAILIHTFLFAVVIVSGPSMEPTLHNNERLIMNKIVYRFSEPKHGDIVVFHASKEDDYIKRIIGLPGDKVEYINNQLYINDEPVNEEYIITQTTKDFGPVIVPEDKLFVLGDNRMNSTDSRILGPIDMAKVVGRVNVLIWPIDRFGMVD